MSSLRLHRSLKQSQGLTARCLRCSSAIRPPSCLGKAPQSRRYANAASLANILKISEEVADGIATNKPVVALESTIYTHGALSKNLAHEHDELVRSLGGIPAIVGVYNGIPQVGLEPAQILEMIESKNAAKVSRRDMSYLVGMVSYYS